MGKLITSGELLETPLRSECVNVPFLVLHPGHHLTSAPGHILPRTTDPTSERKPNS